MAIFDLQAPQSQYAVDPQYADDATARKLRWLGYDQAGMQTNWGKISSWIPGLGGGIGMNLAAKNIAKRGGASDTFANISEDTDNRISKFATYAGVGLAAAGGVTGNPELLKQGLSMTANFGGQLAFDQNGLGLTDDAEYIYR